MAGVCLQEWRNLVWSAMIVILPTSLMGQDSGRAILRSNGGTWLNGNVAPGSSAIFTSDVIQTQKATNATIDADGSEAVIEPETVVQFAGDELILDHGSLQVRTSRAMKVRVNCITIIPVAPTALTRYEVADLDGKVNVSAYESDVKIHYGGGAARASKPESASEATVRQGQQVTREEHCGPAGLPKAAVVAKGAILNSPWAIGSGGIAVGVVTCWALCRGGDPVSPSKP